MPWETSVIQQLFQIRKVRDAFDIIKVTKKWKSRGFPWLDWSNYTCCCTTRLLCLEHGSAWHPESIFMFCYAAPRLKPGLVNEENASSWVKCMPENLSEDCVHFPLAIKKGLSFSFSNKISESRGWNKSNQRCILLYIWEYKIKITPADPFNQDHG